MKEFSNFQPIIKDYSDIWLKIFNLAKQDDIDMSQPLTLKILSDANHKFTQSLIYIYSMETFVFSGMNKASRNKDTSKIELYGPFASALGMIVHCGNKKGSSIDDEQLTETITVFRGLSLSK